MFAFGTSRTATEVHITVADIDTTEFVFNTVKFFKMSQYIDKDELVIVNAAYYDENESIAYGAISGVVNGVFFYWSKKLRMSV